ncbi:hypothetical protein C8J57DRAFT_1731127 [Mycena rebaudengoi]|nr:hypothetical protein C8J57DRAFT_1731127 [Mycena rebaudengoi]
MASTTPSMYGPGHRPSTWNYIRILISSISLLAQVAPVPGLTFILELLREPEMDWDAVKDRIGGLNSEATIATFLAAVQAQVLALSYQDNSTGVKVATNALGFAGVLLDVLTACLALLASTLLQRHTAIVERQLALIEDTSPERLAEIRKVLNALPRFMVPSNLYRRVEDRHAVIVSIESAAAAGQSRPQLRFRDASRDRAPTIGTSFKAIQSVDVITIDITTWTTTTTTLWTVVLANTKSCEDNPQTTALASLVSDQTATPTSPDNFPSEPSNVELYLNIHNTERSKHGASDLVWNETLANAAQYWADECTNQHSGGMLGRFGENLAAGTGAYPISDALQA